MILKVSFNSYGHEIPLKAFPRSLKELKAVVASEVSVHPDDLLLEFFDVEQEKVPIADDIDFEYFADIYAKKPCLIFADVDPQTPANPLTQSAYVGPTQPCLQKKQPEFFGTKLLRMVDHLEVMASSKVTNLLGNLKTNIHTLPPSKRHRRIEFRQLKCLSCEQVPADNKALVCIYCTMYCLCVACEEKIQHRHPMALVKNGFDLTLAESMQATRYPAEARCRSSHYCKVRILSSLFGSKLTDLERRDLVWRHHTLTNEEFLEAMLRLVGETGGAGRAAEGKGRPGC